MTPTTPQDPDASAHADRMHLHTRRIRHLVLGLNLVGLGVLALLDRSAMGQGRLLHTWWPLALLYWGAMRLAWPHRPGGSRVPGLVLATAGVALLLPRLGLVLELPSLRQSWPVLLIAAGALIALRGLWPRGGGRRGP